jgi:hypothetical protein
MLSGEIGGRQQTVRIRGVSNQMFLSQQDI